MADVTDGEGSSTGEYMLTTVDNPFNPFTDFSAWFAWDEASGYHSASLLARVLITSDELSPADQAAARNEAIDEVVRENVLGVFRKVDREFFEKIISHSVDDSELL